MGTSQTVSHRSFGNTADLIGNIENSNTPWYWEAIDRWRVTGIFDLPVWWIISSEVEQGFAGSLITRK